jgi:hypothetical protein
MKVPWVLRWALAQVALTGKFSSISYGSGTYRFEVQPAGVARWLKRRDKRNAEKARKALGVRPPTVGPKGGASNSGASDF